MPTSQLFFLGFHGQTGDRPGAPAHPPRCTLGCRVRVGQETLNPPPPSEGGWRVGYPVGAQRAAGPRSPHCAGVGVLASVALRQSLVRVPPVSAWRPFTPPRPPLVPPPSHGDPHRPVRRPWERVRRRTPSYSRAERGGRGEAPGFLRRGGFADRVCPGREPRSRGGGRGERPVTRGQRGERPPPASWLRREKPTPRHRPTPALCPEWVRGGEERKRRDPVRPRPPPPPPPPRPDPSVLGTTWTAGGCG